VEYVLDIETNGIYPSQIHCCVITQFNDPVTFSTTILEPEELLPFLDLMMNSGDKVITFNGAGYDLPCIKQVWQTDLEEYFKSRGIKHRDAYLIGRMIMPDRGKHSLQSWAEEFGVEGKYDIDFETAKLPELIEYCIQDTIVTYQVYKRLEKLTPRAGKWKHPLEVEQKVASIVAEQCWKGVSFDLPKATTLREILKAKMLEIEEFLAPVMPVLPVLASEQPRLPDKQFKKDGTPSAAMLNYAQKFRNGTVIWRDGYIMSFFEEVPGPLVAILKKREIPLPISPAEAPLLMERLQLSSQQQLKDWLQTKGWKPTLWNKKRVDGKEVRTSPRLTDPVTKEPCPNLVKIPGFAEAGTIADWLMLRARLSLIGQTDEKGLIGLAIKHMGVIPSEAETVGTPTARFRHRGLVNIPRVTTPYGKEFRSLFTAREGMCWVGWDASALEACMEAHYTFPFDGGEYARVLMEGDSKKGTDVHSVNMRKLALPNRDVAKTFKYAITYGAQARKLAASCGATLEVAQRWYDEFWIANPALKALMKALEHEWEALDRKYLMGLDGRLLSTRLPHARLNTKLQGAGAVVMKHAMVIAETMIRRRFPKELAYGLIRYHDEEQWECRDSPDVADEVGRIGVLSIQKAGEYLKLHVPLTGEYKVGYNWCETH